MPVENLKKPTRSIESALTYFSAAEIDVVRFIHLLLYFGTACLTVGVYVHVQVLVPVGDISPGEFDHYATLVMQYRQVRMLASVV